MDERLVERKMITDPIEDTLLMDRFSKLPFYKVSFTEKDLPYASKEHYYFPTDEISLSVPGLVDYQTAYIPDIYSNTEKVSYNRTTNLLELTMRNKHNLVIGDYVMLENKDGVKLESMVEAIPNEFTFSVKNNLPKSYSYFVRGKKVPDLKHLDRDELIILNMRVSQLLELNMKEWAKRTELLEEKVESLEKELRRITNTLNKLR
ncbi:hypothetical protein [Chryseobacterium salviniae]|uniref:Uncharacterized protein n=1 Tax=Chryseobacterium salviniae TaxID=3101750 RepID=A0ABU6HTJ6_9FLAO|nr:hypothetical protein [Chryseobacterium sp. T9W2-O]MEC3876044.1 hypothetical protein [Chryseobacterium sp. T9W2-O]